MNVFISLSKLIEDILHVRLFTLSRYHRRLLHKYSWILPSLTTFEQSINTILIRDTVAMVTDTITEIAFLSLLYNVINYTLHINP